MTSVPFFWVDAFTDRPFGGNPAGVCLLDGPADDRWMQQLAFELGLSETAYVWPVGGDGGAGDGNRFGLRWFTPTVEVDLCGHATLASAHALAQSGRAVDGDRLTFDTRSGQLAARLDGSSIELDLPAAAPRPVDPPAALAAAWPVTAAVAGGDDLVLVLDSVAAVRAAVPDPAVLGSLPYRAVVVTALGPGTGAGSGDETGPGAGVHAGDGAHTGEGGSPEVGADYVLRVFGCNVGIAEDPVTGSAQCVLGPYWAARLGRTVLEVAQVSPRSGRLRVTVGGDRVGVAGTAVTVLRGDVDGP